MSHSSNGSSSNEIAPFLERFDGAFQEFYVVLLDYCIKPAGEHRDEVIWRGLREVGRGWGG